MLISPLFLLITPSLPIMCSIIYTFYSSVSGSASRPTITRSCALKITNIIRNNLDMENLEIFETSCFGRLMKINELRFQGQLMFHLLRSLDMAASSKKSLVFKINDSTMTFGERDFHDITGLCLGEREVTSMPSFIQEHVFRGRSSIVFKEVEETFLKYSSHYQGRGELTLKLAFLYFLYGILLSGSHIKKVDTSYLYLIENLDEFNAFPWGEIGHEFFVSSLLSARVLMCGSKISRLNIHGFGFALQIWAYEKMPSLATHCANNLGDLSPQILRWSATKIVYFETLKKFFGNDAQLVRSNLSFIISSLNICSKYIMVLQSNCLLFILHALHYAYKYRNHRAMSFVDSESERRVSDQYGI